VEFDIDEEVATMTAVPSHDGPVEVIVLNGASSTGKTTLAAALQDVLEESWLVFGIDTLISALPLALLEIHEEAIIGAHPKEHEVRPGGIRFDANGEIAIGSEFRRLEEAWLHGLSMMAASGVRLILDEVFLDGALSQNRVRQHLDGRHVVWVGVTCDVEVATRRERDRGDRVVGASAQQIGRVHQGVDYDLIVDTTSRSSLDVATEIAGFTRFNGRRIIPGR
jgi:chloramphenicol 3-O phosphotransferase